MNYRKLMNAVRKQLFPSPTGVNYYESIICQIGASVLLECFRPQQGLTIMNYIDAFQAVLKNEFPSPTGVNYYELNLPKPLVDAVTRFPSPTGVNYYE